MKKVLSISFCMVALVVIAMWATDVDAFQFYSDATNDQGGCAQCHTGFRDNNNYFSLAEGVPWNDSLHNVHLNNTTVDSSCDNCHSGAGSAGRTVNIGSSANAADGVNAIACTGCHVPEGLRAHHTVNGVTLCAGCHPNDPPPQPESILPPWYGSVINDNTGTILKPCNICGEENLAGLAIGLDNDGNNFYDTGDPDCDCGPTGISETVCNGVDDDCDGIIDEDYVMDDTCGIGVCGFPNNTPSSCVDGVETPCQPGPQSEPTDVTCDGADGDCDGAVDEDFVPMPTTCGTGVCESTGQTICMGGAQGDTCIPGTPSVEICDNLDNDCDGATDENLARSTICGVGECTATGEETCTAGVWGNDTCTPGTPSPEVCDASLLDEDCDGIVNEGCCCAAGETRACGSDVGECVFGIQTCIVSDTECGWSNCVGDVGPSAEVCDNLDNDCDGLIDEDLTRPTTCGVGECAGNTGEETCTAGIWGNDTCDPLAGRECEVCDINNLDEDCDGIVNEGCTCVAGDLRSCGSDVGECVAGTEECIQTCYEGNFWSGICLGEVGPTEEVCDNLDNDCDGTVDEGGVCEPDAVDLDIARFRVSKSVKLGDEVKRIQLTVENPNGGGQDMRPATLIGIQNGMEVYNKTRMVFDLSGNGRSRFAFPPFTPTEVGTISWTVEILDDDPDDDIATATTNVK